MLKLRTLNAADAFIAGSFTVLLPLLLVSRNIDVATIGVILAISPAVFLFSRLITASLSDLWGIRKFFILNAVGNALASFSYAFAVTPIGYSVGKVLEGVGSGSIWAVDRTAVSRTSKERDPAVDFSLIQGIRLFASALAVIAVGYCLQIFSFEIVLISLAVIGILMFFISFSLEEKVIAGGRMNMRLLLSQIDPRKKSKLLIRTSLVMMLYSFASSSLLSLVFPLYLNERTFTYAQIGLILSLQRFGEGGALWFGVKKIGLRLLAVLGFIMFAAPLLVILFSPVLLIPILILVTGISMGFGDIIWEKLVFNATRRSKTMSSDVGVIQIPAMLASVFSLALSGLLISWFGYGVVFALIALAYSAYLLLSYKILGK